MSRCTDDKLVNVIRFVVNDIQTLINFVKISYVQISLMYKKKLSISPRRSKETILYLNCVYINNIVLSDFNYNNIDFKRNYKKIEYKEDN